MRERKGGGENLLQHRTNQETQTFTKKMICQVHLNSMTYL